MNVIKSDNAKAALSDSPWCLNAQSYLPFTLSLSLLPEFQQWSPMPYWFVCFLTRYQSQERIREMLLLFCHLFFLPLLCFKEITENLDW